MGVVVYGNHKDELQAVNEALKRAQQEVVAVRAEAEEWKRKYTDEFQKRMALRTQLLDDDWDTHTGYNPGPECVMKSNF